MTSSSTSRPRIVDYVGAWVLRPDRTTISIRSKAMRIFPVQGTFVVVEGNLVVSPTGSVSGTVVIDAASVNTKNKKRDAHLRTADFFDVETYPTFVFDAPSVSLQENGQVGIRGMLTILGQTLPIDLLGEIESSGTSLRVTAESTINRSDWGMSKTPAGASLATHLEIAAQFDRS
jgi:polyisoprenoid-binding protein YceI